MIRALWKKEWQIFKRSSLSKSLLGGFTILSSFFFMAFLLFFQSSALISIYLSNVAMIGVWLCPFLTMRSFAEEKQLGTDLLLRTSSLSLRQLWIGKWGFTMGIWTLCLGLTLPLTGLIHLLSHAPVGPTGVAYLGLWLFGTLLCAMGTCFSFFTSHPITAALLSLTTGLLAWMSEGMLSFLSPKWQDVLSVFSLQHHLDPFINGLLNLQSLAFFGLGMAVFTTVVLRDKKSIFITTVLGGWLILTQFNPVQVSVQPEPLLTPKTQWVLSTLQKPVTLTLFCHPKAPEFNRIHALLERLHHQSSFITVRYEPPRGEAEIQVQTSIHLQRVPKGQWYRIEPGSMEQAFTAETAIALAILQVTRPVQNWKVLGGKASLFQYPHINFTQNEKMPIDGLVVVTSPELAGSERRFLEHWSASGKPILIILEPFTKNPLHSFLASRGISTNSTLIFEDASVQAPFTQATPIWNTPRPFIQVNPLLMTSDAALAGHSDKADRATFHGPFIVALWTKDTRTKSEWVVIGSQELFADSFAALLHQPPESPPQTLRIYSFRLTRFSFSLIALGLLVFYPLLVIVLWKRNT